VKLERYDIHGVQWENGIAHVPVGDREMLGGWFKDSEGNIIGFGEYVQS
jgi:hypothetical protein